MAYVALYRKYRSQTFDDVVGQEHITRTLQNAIKSGRIGHAYLFCGSRGTGKTTVARLIAKAVNCVNGPTAEPCNQCEACLSVGDGSAVDVIEMDAASHRGVDDVAAIRDNVKYPPMNLRYKIYIIDEAHQLSRDAKDAFLKTLEEPPAHAIFILATTESHAIPATIRSRCQQFDFRRGSLADIAGRLKYVCEQENVKIDEAALSLLAKSAGGSWRDALSLLEQVLAYTENEVTAKDVSAVLGSVDIETLFEVGEVLAERDPAKAFQLADRLVAEGRDIRELLRSITGHLRDLVHTSVGLPISGEFTAMYKEQATKFTRNRLIHLVETFAASEKEMRWNDQHRLVLELAMLKGVEDPAVAARASAPAAQAVQAPVQQAPIGQQAPSFVPPAPQPVTRPEPAVETSSEVQKPTERRFAPQSPTRPEEKPSAPVVQQPERDELQPVPDMQPVEASGGGAAGIVDEMRRNWGRILTRLKETKNVPIQAWLKEGQPVGTEGDFVVIAFPESWQFAKSRLEDHKTQQIISDIMQSVLGKRAKLKGKILSRGELMNAASELDSSEDMTAQNPLVDDVLSIFGGQVMEEDNESWEDT